MTKTLILFLIVLMPLWGYEAKNIHDRVFKLRTDNEKMLVQEKKAVTPSVSEAMPVAKATDTMPAPQGDRITRLEVTVYYMQRYIDDLRNQVRDLNSNLIEIVAAMEAQTKVAESSKTKSDRADLIINIILGLVSVFVGGGGYVAYKNKHLVFRPKKDDLSQTKG